ncbi:hypothetical protein [Polyangium aurulentum]|uniref:hypothetical protein n=1 Tax=Polyangium aurulentum TaxID=2567896 RepID=UPI0010ADF9E9|nr:hypothetical protein [Polyangium aurulentum]UQA60757.1 hypothetical protein E8A73_009855 [Polyangium aurulentum]
MKSFLLNFVSRALVFTAVCSALPACRTDAEAVCDYKCECEGCSNADLDNCYWRSEDDEIDADRRGCIDLHDELRACEYETGVCRGAKWDTACGPEKDRYKNCMD